MWVRNAWYVAGWAEEFVPGTLHARTVIGEPLVIYRCADGGLVCLEDRCCHRFAPLSRGRLEGDELRCMYHGLKFGRDGRCTEIPGQSTIPERACVRTFAAVESGCWLWIWMGDQAAADPAGIPNTVARDDPEWHIGTGTLDYAADYRLINDNLLDLSHLSFAHEKTLGRGQPRWAEERPDMVRLPRGLRFQRWNRDDPASSFLSRFGNSFDVRTGYDYLLPGIFLQRTGWYSAGTADRAGLDLPDEAPYFVRFDDHAVTPVSERASRYYYVAGGQRSVMDEEAASRMLDFSTRAFLEDKDIIEAQQRVIDRDPERPMLPTTLDAGPTRFRRIIDEFLAVEAA